MNAILLYAQPYKVTDEKTGEVNEGISLWFHGSDSLKPRVREANGQLKMGVKPYKANLPANMIEQIKAVPGLYEIDTVIEGGTQNKAQMIVTDIDFKYALDIKQAEEKQPSKVS